MEILSQVLSAVAAVLVVVVVAVKADVWWALAVVAVFLFVSSYALYQQSRRVTSGVVDARKGR